MCYRNTWSNFRDFELLSDIMFQNHFMYSCVRRVIDETLYVAYFGKYFAYFHMRITTFLRFWRLSRYWTPVFVRDLCDLTKLKTSNLLSFLSKIIISDHVSCRDTFFGYTFSSKSITHLYSCLTAVILKYLFYILPSSLELQYFPKSEEIILKWKVGVILKLFKENFNI